MTYKHPIDRRLFQLFASPKPEWSGIAAGCSHPHANPRRDDMHTIERQAEQLSMAGVSLNAEFDRRWLDTNIAHFGLPALRLLVPGGARTGGRMATLPVTGAAPGPARHDPGCSRTDDDVMMRFAVFVRRPLIYRARRH